MKRVLITGTTSGIGRSLLNYFVAEGMDVISVNRREAPEIQKAYPQCRFEILDIADQDAVRACLVELTRLGKQPDVLILNAGINKMDNSGHFDFNTYKNVERINLHGVLSFIGVVQELEWKGKTILGMTSTSSIVPNPGHLSYYLSKLNIECAFRIFNQSNPVNSYKTLNLGPIHTNIMAGYEGPRGIQRKIFDFLAVPSDRVAPVAHRLILSRRKTARFTLLSHVFYGCVRILLKIFPGLYRGAALPSATQADLTSPASHQ